MKQKVKKIWKRLPKLIRVIISLYVILLVLQTIPVIIFGIIPRIPWWLFIIIIIGAIVAISVWGLNKGIKPKNKRK